MKSQPTIFDGDRMTLPQAVALTVEQLDHYGPLYRHWAIAWSGGKDSTALVTAIIHLIGQGRIKAPERLTVLYADTRMELPPLWLAANGIRHAMIARGIDVRVVLPEMDDRFWVYMLGRGVPPPKNDFRWCTAQLKIEPMEAALPALQPAGDRSKVLMLTGVRLGESAARNQTIAISCGRDGAECGQGWLHLSPDKKKLDNINQYFVPSGPDGVTDTLAPILHWRTCHVWDWLADTRLHGFETVMLAEAYDQDLDGSAIETSARTGCICCPLASRDHALERIVRRDGWAYLTPLLDLRNLWAELRKPGRRLRKAGGERRKDGSLSRNQNRMGPLTMDARRFALEFALDVQDRVNRAAVKLGRPAVDFLNPEEVDRIRTLIAANTWPDKWTGDEPIGDEPFEDVYGDGSRQLLLPVIDAGGVS